jgi:hypothetical protein
MVNKRAEQALPGSWGGVGGGRRWPKQCRVSKCKNDKIKGIKTNQV